MEWVENDLYSISRGECLYGNRNLFFLVQAFVNYINQLFNLLFDWKILLCSQYFLLSSKCSLQTMIRPKLIEGKFAGIKQLSKVPEAANDATLSEKDGL